MPLGWNGLWVYGQHSGVRYGAAIRPGWLKEDPAYAAALANECNIAVTEGQMAWTTVEPQFGELNFERADQGVAWAAAHGIPLRGHHLISAHVVPEWLEGLSAGGPQGTARVAPDDACQPLQGKINTWDRGGARSGSRFSEASRAGS